ncbi:O-antigen ligase [Geobacter sp. DSM 9736]|uniref:O-antigen ligase family protein n=1 Tax=Geobacter sp. DSM 9736 TaxID=1277350 RepID=UPI000B50D04F|nr:hypothetical protein [Geobacter sp. DSM 9736]SNB47969.1 hypothetical protein SAMN06269301_3463 [Geobacter sp. DSM 9736]
MTPATGTQPALEPVQCCRVVPTRMPELLLLSLLIGSCFLPAEIISAVMLLLFLLLIADPFGEGELHRFPGMMPFLLLLLAGLLDAPGNAARDVAKDLWYVGNAAMTLWVAFLAARKMEGLTGILRIFLAAGVVVAFIHLCRFAVDPMLLSSSVIEIRTEAGVGYLLPALGLGVLLADWRYGLGLVQNRIPSWLCGGLCLASVTLAFSRTLWIALLTFLLVLVGLSYLKQMMKAAAVAGAILIALMASPLSDERAEPGSEATFSEKITNSLAELRVADYEDDSDIHRNWRGFESYRALQTYAEGGAWTHLVGKGFGTGIDLGLTMVLMEEEFDSIPILHNGYLYLLVKAGLAGVAAYLAYMFLSIRRGAAILRLQPRQARACGYLIIALTLFMLQATLVISGLFNKGWIFPGTLLLGMLLGHAESLLHEKGSVLRAN